MLDLRYVDDIIGSLCIIQISSFRNRATASINTSQENIVGAHSTDIIYSRPRTVSIEQCK